MTDALVRLGLPNSVAVLALAVMPFVAMAMARADMARSESPDGTYFAGSTTPADANGAVFE
jgi:hypothetical protein